ncbi:MAG: thioredoxin domain-containing protein, partial [Lewinella sp.]|nr:thioredoxin domain-containing protein [Lewinella sp.]
RERMRQARERRTPPHQDGKVILGWNALLVSAYVQMHLATGEATYLNWSLKHLDFLRDNFIHADGTTLSRTLTNGTSTPHPATLKDYAFLIRAMLDVFQVTFDRELLQQAQSLTDAVFDYFLEEDTRLFNFSRKDLPDVIFARKDLKDDEMPSGNAVMARNLQDLGLLLDKDQYRRQATQMLTAMQTEVVTNPLTYAAWTSALLAETKGIMEVAVVGADAMEWTPQLHRIFIPFKVLVASSETVSDLPLLAGKTTAGQQTLIYVCQDYACQRPMDRVEEFVEQYVVN